MADIDPRHIETVGAFIDRVPAEAEMTPEYILRPLSHSIAAALLSSADPAVLDAMQDALVRAGRLTEERRQVPRWVPCDDPEHTHGGLVGQGPDLRAQHISEWVWERQLVTDWQGADQ